MKTQEEIEQLAEQYINKYTGDHYVYCAYVDAYTQCQEDMSDKKYTEEDLLDAWELGASVGLPLTRDKKEKLFKALQPKIE